MLKACSPIFSDRMDSCQIPRTLHFVPSHFTEQLLLSAVHATACPPGAAVLFLQCTSVPWSLL